MGRLKSFLIMHRDYFLGTAAVIRVDCGLRTWQESVQCRMQTPCTSESRYFWVIPPSIFASSSEWSAVINYLGSISGGEIVEISNYISGNISLPLWLIIVNLFVGVISVVVAFTIRLDKNKWFEDEILVECDWVQRTCKEIEFDDDCWIGCTGKISNCLSLDIHACQTRLLLVRAQYWVGGLVSGEDKRWWSHVSRRNTIFAGRSHDDHIPCKPLGEKSNFSRFQLKPQWFLDLLLWSTARWVVDPRWHY